MKKIFWTLFCLTTLSLPSFGETGFGGPNPGNPPKNVSGTGSTPKRLSQKSLSIYAYTGHVAASESTTDKPLCAAETPVEPASLSPRTAFADAPQLALSVTPGNCNSSTNQYTLTGSISLTNAVASSLTVTDGTLNTTVSVTTGQTSAIFSLAGLTAGTGTHTVTVSGPNYTPISTTSTAPFAIAGVTTISCTTVSVTQRRLSINPQYTGTDGSPITFGVVSEISPTTNPGPYTLNLFTDNPAVTLNAQQGNTQSTYRYNWLEACNAGPTSTYASVSTSYTAPASCTATAPTPQLTLSVTPGGCNNTTNQYILTGTISLTNAVASSLTVSDGIVNTTVSIVAGQTSATFSLTSLPAGTNGRTVTVSGSGYPTISAGYTAPAACSTTPTNPTGTPRLALSVTAGSCSSATNQYTLTGSISLTNAVASSLTVSDGTINTIVPVVAGQTTASFSLAGLLAGTGTHTVIINGAGYSPTSTTNTAPFALVGVTNVSCTTISVTQRLISINPVYTGTNGSPITFGVVGEISPTTSPGPYTLNLYTDNPAITLNAQQGNTQSTYRYNWLDACNAGPTSSTAGAAASASYSAPASCAVAPPCSLILSVSPGACNTSNNQYAITGTVSANNANGSQTVTLTDGSATTTITLTGNGPATFALSGLYADGTGHTLVASSSTCGNISTNYAAPVACTTAPLLALVKRVDKARAAIGDLLTYTLVITNNGTASATNVVVRDSMSTGLTYVANSATPPTGTTFSKGPLTTSTWSIASLPVGQNLSLTFQARVDSSGVLYNRATIPGALATTCTSIPVNVCTGDTYVFRITVATGRTNYKWYRNDIEIVGQTTNVLDVTTPGEYRMASDNSSGRCTDSSCCPFIVVENALPTFQATALPATCVGNAPQSNGKITVAGFSAAYTYQYSAGASFNPGASLSGAAQPVPANGVLVSTLVNPATAQAYTVRMYNSSGCYSDVTVQLQPVVCSSSGSLLALSVMPGSCNNTTNQYILTGSISLTNAVASSLTVTDGSVNMTVSIVAGQTTASFSLGGLTSGTGSHTVIIAGTGYTAASVTYTAPTACAVCSLSLSTTVLVNGQVGTAYSQTLTSNGSAPVTYSITSGSLPGGLSLNTATGVISGVPTSATTVSFQVSLRDSKNCTAVATLTITTTANPVCSLTPTANPGACNPATNTYTLTGSISAANSSESQSLTVSVGTTRTTLSLTGNGPISYTLTGLPSDGLAKTLTVISSASACAGASVNFTAPVSCSVTPTPALALSVTPGSCNGNQYTLTGIISLTNAIASSLTVTDGSVNTTVSIVAGQTTASFSLSGLISGTGSHTVTLSGPGYPPATAPFAIAGVTTISCTTVSVTQRRLSINPQYTGTDGSPITFGVVSEISPTTNPGPYTLNLFTDNPAVTLNAQQGNTQSTYRYNWLEACNAGPTSPTGTIGYSPVSVIYTAPASCSTTPGVPKLALSVIPGSCTSATNQYTLTGTISLTNAIASSLTVTDGTSTTTIPVVAGQTTASFSLTGLTSGTGTHTVILGGAGYTTIAATYSAPASCSVTPTPPTPLLALSVTPGSCTSATNQYTLTGTISLTNAIASSLTVSDGSVSTTVAVVAGQTTASFSLTGPDFRYGFAHGHRAGWSGLYLHIDHLLRSGLLFGDPDTRLSYSGPE